MKSKLSYWDLCGIEVEEREREERYKNFNIMMGEYYKRQRILGFIFMVFGLVTAIIGYAYMWEKIQTIGLILLGFGFYCTLTRRMIYIDSFYLECHDRMRSII